MNDGLLLRLTNDLQKLIQTQQELVEATQAASDTTLNNLTSLFIFLAGVGFNAFFKYCAQVGEKRREKEQALKELTTVWKEAESKGHTMLHDCLDALSDFEETENPRQTQLYGYIACLEEVEREWLPDLERKCHGLIFQLGINDQYLTLSNEYKDHLWAASKSISEFQQALSESGGRGCTKPDVSLHKKAIRRAHRRLLNHLQSLANTPMQSGLLSRVTSLFAH